MHVTYACELAHYEMLSETLCDVQIERSGIISGLRMMKDDAELGKLREMYTCVKMAFEMSLESFMPGRSELL